MKKPVRLLVPALLLFGLLAYSASAVDFAKSGDLQAEKPSKETIAQWIAQSPMTVPASTPLFAVKPVVSPPYAPGRMTDAALQVGLNRLNLLRKLAGLPTCVLDASLNQNAQYGAVLLVKRGSLSHFPERPKDMPEAFYKQGYEATSTSNLWGGWGNFSPFASLDSFLDDSDASNIDRVGHRRWILNPTLYKVGYGFAQAKNQSSSFAALKVFDKSGAGCDFDFLAWPASGFFPNNLPAFTKDSAWSVTLNPEKYQTPKQSNVSIALTRESDGRTWSFARHVDDNVKAQKYFHIDTGGYGVSGWVEDRTEGNTTYYKAEGNAIIFRPHEIDQYQGTYTVTIDGLSYKDGSSAPPLRYQVEFFNPKMTAQKPKPTAPKPANYVGTFTDVAKTAYFADAVKWAVDKQIAKGTSPSTFSPNDTCTRAQILTFLHRAYGAPSPTIPNPFLDVQPKEYYKDATLWAQEKGLVQGMFFTPDAPCTRADTVLYLWKLAGAEEMKGDFFDDVPEGSPYYDAVTWAYGNITKGTSERTFSPNDTCPRAQIMTFLYRALHPSE